MVKSSKATVTLAQQALLISLLFKKNSYCRARTLTFLEIHTTYSKLGAQQTAQFYRMRAVCAEGTSLKMHEMQRSSNRS